MLTLTAIVLATSLTVQDAAPVEEPTFPQRPAIFLTARPVADLVDELWHEDEARAEAAAVTLFWLGEPVRESVEPWTRARHAQASRLARQVIGWLDAHAALEPAAFTEAQAGYCLMGTDVPDRGALGGFATRINPSKPLEPKRAKALDAPLLEVDENQLVLFRGRHPGLVVRLINGGDEPLRLAAQDSRIAIVAEALDAEGKWRPIEHLPSSTCGNSYHRVTLSPARFVEFAVPRYEGPLKTQVRWRLTDELVTEAVDLAIHPDQLR